jgi:biopolymer transport protein ExbD
MRIRAPGAEQETPINLMPLIDMVFLLVVFFLVAGQLAQAERDQRVKLPITSSKEPLSAQPRHLIINILADGTTKIGPDTIGPDRLRKRLAQLAPDAMVLIRADKASRHEHFARVVRLCRAAGVDEVKIGYIVEEGAGAAGD